MFISLCLLTRQAAMTSLPRGTMFPETRSPNQHLCPYVVIILYLDIAARKWAHIRLSRRSRGGGGGLGCCKVSVIGFLLSFGNYEGDNERKLNVVPSRLRSILWFGLCPSCRCVGPCLHLHDGLHLVILLDLVVLTSSPASESPWILTEALAPGPLPHFYRISPILLDNHYYFPVHLSAIDDDLQLARCLPKQDLNA